MLRTVCLCLVNLLALANTAWHKSHWWLGLSEWIFTCSFNPLLYVKLRSHRLQGYALSPKCALWWRSRTFSESNDLEHNSQLHLKLLLNSGCVCLCRRRPPDTCHAKKQVLRSLSLSYMYQKWVLKFYRFGLLCWQIIFYSQCHTKRRLGWVGAGRGKAFSGFQLAEPKIGWNAQFGQK